MKNITDFSKFRDYKKIEEASTPTLAKSADIGGYGGGTGTDTYFANVKGNFAGAENTLIGSAVMKIFGFFKRKINEGILFIYKKALFREYLANVLRYAAKNDITYQSENTLFEVKQVKNAAGEAEEKEVVKVKFIKVDKTKKSLTPYEVGAKVVDEQNKVVVDGTYQNITETSQFVVKGGLIESITPIELPTPQEGETLQPAAQTGTTEAQTGSTETEDMKNIGDDVKQIANDVNKILKNINNISDEELNQYLVKLKAILENIRLSGIFEIDQLLKNKNLPVTHKEELEKDRKVYVDEQTILKKLYQSLVDAKAKKGTTKTATATPKPEAKQKTVVKQESLFGFEDDDMLNEEIKITKGISFRGVKLGGVDKKLADEVGDLDLKVLEDENFAKNFEDKSVKDAVTALVKENSQPIQKIQLAAERMYKVQQPSNATIKLENTWQRMVKDDLALFSRYMNTEEVSPFVLVQGASTQTRQDAEKLGKGTEQSGKDSLATENALLKIKDGFGNSMKTYGILSTTAHYFMYYQDQVKIGASTYWAYKIIGTVDMDKLKAVKEESGITSTLNYKKNELAAKLTFPNTANSNTAPSYPSFDAVYQCSYFINTSPGNHLKTIKSSTEPRPNDINLLALYVHKDAIPLKTFDPADYLKTYFFVYRDEKKNKNIILRDVSKVIPSTEYSMGMRSAWQITDASAAIYEIPDTDKKPNIAELTAVPQVQTLRPGVTTKK